MTDYAARVHETADLLRPLANAMMDAKLGTPERDAAELEYTGVYYSITDRSVRSAAVQILIAERPE